MADHRPGTAEAIGFLLVPNFTLIAFAAAAEPLRLANHIVGAELYRRVLVARDGGAEVCSGGVTVAVDHALADAPPLHTIVVCGGAGSHRFDDRATIAFLRRAAALGTAIGSVCIGSHILARAGLLDGYRCTIHWENLAGFVETFPNLEATGELYTVDRDRFTCAGGTAATDMMLRRIADDHGDKLAIRVAEQMLHDKIRPGSRAQQTIQPAIAVERRELMEAIALMRQNIEEPLDQLSLSARLGQSRRNVERMFRKYVGSSPARYYLDMRLDRARELLHQTDMSVMEVGLSCGFVSATHFSKSYRDHFGVPPRDDQGRRAPRASPSGASPAPARPAPMRK